MNNKVILNNLSSFEVNAEAFFSCAKIINLFNYDHTTDQQIHSSVLEIVKTLNNAFDPENHSIFLNAPRNYLIAMSIELILKNIIKLQKLNKKCNEFAEVPETHDLSELTKEISICTIPTNASLLKKLTHVINWSSKYPYPKERHMHLVLPVDTDGLVQGLCSPIQLTNDEFEESCELFRLYHEASRKLEEEYYNLKSL